MARYFYSKDDNSETQNISFSSFYSNLLKSNLNQLDINVLLPISTESINSPSVVFHCMKIVMGLTNHLDSGQTTVMVADQPVYAITKQL